jgi:hypothetical protein
MSLARTAAILTDKGEVPEQLPVIKLLGNIPRNSRARRILSG